MAAGAMIAIRDEASVNGWKADAERLNERANTIIQQSMDLLKSFSEMAEGNIFTQMISLADQVVQGMTKVMESLTELLNAVTELVNYVKNILSNLVEGVGKLRSGSIG